MSPSSIRPRGGGVRTYIDRKFEVAAQLGHELFVIAPGPEDRFESRGPGGLIQVRTPRLPFDANYHMFWEAAPVHRWLDSLSPDLVEASSPWRGAWIVANWPAPAARAMFMHADPVAIYPQRWLAPVASPERIDQLFDWFWSYLRKLTGRFNAVVAGGLWLARRFEQHGVAAVAGIPLGVDRGLFSPRLRDERLRSELLRACSCPEDAKLALAVGRFHPEKRWPMVIEATSRASADVKTFAMKHVRDLETKIGELQAMSRTLRHLAQTCHGDDRPECPILADLALPDARQPPPEKKRGKAKTHADCACDEGDTFSGRH